MGELNRSLRVSASLGVVLLVYLVCRVAGRLVSRLSSSIGFEVGHVARFTHAIDLHTGWASIRGSLGFAA